MILADADVKERRKSMPNVEIIKEKNAVLVPLSQWERVQNELVRLRKKVKKEKLLREIRATIIEVETDIRNGVKPRGRDAREFIAELMNEK